MEKTLKIQGFLGIEFLKFFGKEKRIK